MNFKDKVLSMTAKEIIMAMVDSLTRPPLIKIDMSSFGHAKRTWHTLFLTKTCFGCAATNTVCQIAGIKFTPSNIEKREEVLETDVEFLTGFEFAIDGLRLGNTRNYNRRAQSILIAEIHNPGIDLPILNDNYTNEDLEPYKRLAEAQP